jgi:hypothetical protein
MHPIKQKQSEGKIQSQCFLWLWNNYPLTRGLLYHIPNGGLRTPLEASRFKAMGVVPGIPDFCLAIHSIAYPESHYSALYIEMKTDKGRESTEQLQIHKTLREAGNRVETVRSFEEFQTLILEYLKGTRYLLK